MTTTTYYELNIVEGTDIVNPLTVDNPNYEKIDETMHNNAVAGVTLATEITNATVHAITRENSDCAAIRFIATSKWKAGDTATVDGVPVTALLPSGETLPDGAYVINANVLCILTGTNLTFYVGGKNVENASDIKYNDTNVKAELDELNASVEQINVSVAQINSNLNMRWNPETDYIQILKDGEWVNYEKAGLLRKYLYFNGDTKDEITGGYSASGWKIGGVNASNPTFNSNNVELNTSGTEKVEVMATVNMIYLTDKSKIHFSIHTTSGANGIFYGLSTSKTISDFANLKKTGSITGTYQDYTIDVSSISGSYYIWAFVYGTSGTGYINEIWYE